MTNAEMTENSQGDRSGQEGPLWRDDYSVPQEHASAEERAHAKGLGQERDWHGRGTGSEGVGTGAVGIEWRRRGGQRPGCEQLVG